MTKLEVIQKVNEILKQHCDNPSEQMVKEGQALVAIGKALKGMSIAEARATMRAVEELTIVTKE